MVNNRLVLILNTAEKLEIARQLERFGVDIIEAGFPASSPGDFEAVKLIARYGEKFSLLQVLLVRLKVDIETSWEALKGAQQPTSSCIYRNITYPYAI